MTVSSSNAVVVHITNTSVTQYSFDFKVFNASELLVTLPVFSGSPHTTDEEMLLNTHYTVTGVGDSGGGNILLTSAGISLANTGKRLVIRRNMPFIQDTEFEQHSVMPAVMVTRSFDIATMERQELRAIMARALLADESVTNPIPYSEFVALHDAAVDAALDATNAVKAAETLLADIEALSNAIQSGVGDVEGIAAQISADIAKFRAEVAAIESNLMGLFDAEIKKIEVQIQEAIDGLSVTEDALRLDFDNLSKELTSTVSTAIADLNALRDEIKAIVEGLEESGLVVLAATQEEVDTGTVTERYVNPLTLNNWSKLADLATSTQAQSMADLAFTNATAWAGTQVDALSGQMAMKAPLDSPALTGTPTATTPPTGNNSIRVPTTAWVNTTIAAHNTSSAAHSDLFASITVPAATTTVSGSVVLATATDTSSTTKVPPAAVVQSWLSAVGGGDQAASIAVLQAAFNTSQQIMHVYDKKSANGGTFTSGAWRTRDLNTIGINTINGASLASNQITLPAGAYFIQATAPAQGVSGHQARLFNVTTSTTLAYGQNHFSVDYAYTSSASTISAHVTLSTSTVIELQHQCQVTMADFGFGTWVGFGDDIFSMLTVRRIS